MNTTGAVVCIIGVILLVISAIGIASVDRIEKTYEYSADEDYIFDGYTMYINGTVIENVDDVINEDGVLTVETSYTPASVAVFIVLLMLGVGFTWGGFLWADLL